MAQRAVLLVLLMWIGALVPPSAALAEVSAQDDEYRHLAGRLKEIAALHRDLFEQTQDEFRLPVGLPPREKRFLRVQDLIAALPRLTPGDRSVIELVLDEATADVEASYRDLDERARWFLKYTPTRMRTEASSRDITFFWALEDTTGLNGARNFARRKLAVLRDLSALSPQAREARWDRSLRRAVFRNEALMSEDQELASRLIHRQLHAGYTEPPLTEGERQDLERLGLSFDKARTFKVVSDERTGADRLSFVEFGDGNIVRILRSHLRQAPKPAVWQSMTQRLQSMTARILSVLRPEIRERAADVEFVPDVAVTSGAKPYRESLWFEAERTRDAQRSLIKAAGPALVAGFATCAIQSEAAASWRDSPKAMASTPMTVSQQLEMRPEADALAKPIVHLEHVVDQRDFWQPLASDRVTRLRAMRGVVEGYDRCIERYFGYVLAHELAHLYLIERSEGVLGKSEAAERMADCAAMRSLNALVDREGRAGRAEFALGFMTHYLQADSALADGIEAKGLDPATFGARFAAMEAGRCLREPLEPILMP